MERDPIAIVGMACNFPGDSNTLDKYWRLLIEKKDGICDIPPDRWNAEKFYSPDYETRARINVCRGGFISDIDKFDASFFGISPIEARRIDPQQRLLLETAYNALDNAGIPLAKVSGSATGVYIGISTYDFGAMSTSVFEWENIGQHTMTGISLSIAANRISYTFNLQGPSFCVDTACSSSLLSTHLACRDLWSGETQTALAGGVNLLVRPESTMGFSKGGFLSPKGRCLPFSPDADGYVRSEGVGMVVLKRLSQAMADNDRIYATILGSATNQDGHTPSMIQPSTLQQINVMQAAYKDACVNPKSIQYIEAHGTGTPLGDQAEGRSIIEVIGRRDLAEKPCFVGSAKANIGHLEAGSGIAGLIKLALSMYHQQIPGMAHFTQVNPAIPFSDFNLIVPRDLTSWPCSGKSCLAGINSFGFGGANVHLCLSSGPQKASIPKIKDSSAQLFFLSARTEDDLKAVAKGYQEIIQAFDGNISLDELCYSANARKTNHAQRVAVVANSKNDLKEKLSKILNEKLDSDIIAARVNKNSQGKLAYVFSGQGAQWWGMGRELYREKPIFRSAIEAVDLEFQKLSNWSIVDEMMRSEAGSRMDETVIAQPALMAIQIALAKLWIEAGVHADGVIGHSIGEIAAAHSAGVLSLQEAVTVIYHRSRIQSNAAGKGKMLAVGLAAEDAKEIISPFGNRISIAAMNSPEFVTLSGDSAPLEEIAKECGQKEIFHRFLKVDVPFHSYHMDGCKEELIPSLRSLTPRESGLPLYSTVTGAAIDGKLLDAEYWYRNVREPVCYTEAIGAMIDDGYRYFIEIGPHPILLSGCEAMAEKKKVQVTAVHSLRRTLPERNTFLQALGKLFVGGFDPDFIGSNERLPRFCSLPSYPFHRDLHWLESETHKRSRLDSPVHPHLKNEIRTSEESNCILWEIDLDVRVHPYLLGHRGQGHIIFPGAGQIDLMISAYLASFKTNRICLRNLELKKPIFLPEDDSTPEIRLEISANQGCFSLFTREASSNSALQKVSQGYYDEISETDFPLIDARKFQNRIRKSVDVSRLYKEFSEGGLQFEKSFRILTECFINETESFGKIQVPDVLVQKNERFSIHPCLLDSAFHTALAMIMRRKDRRSNTVYLPVKIGKIKFFGAPVTKNLYVYSKLSSYNNREGRIKKICLFNEKDEVICDIHDFIGRSLEGVEEEGGVTSDTKRYETQWEPFRLNDFADVKPESPSKKNQTWLVFADDGKKSKILCRSLRNEGDTVICVRRGRAFKRKEGEYRINPSSVEDMRTLFDEDIISRELSGIVYLWPLDALEPTKLTSKSLRENEEKLSIPLIYLSSLLEADFQQSQIRLWIVTSGCQKLSDDVAPIHLTQSSCIGIGRTIISEFPNLQCNLIDVSLNFNDSEMDRLVDLSRIDCWGEELAIRSSKVYASRLQELDLDQARSRLVKTVPSMQHNFQSDVQELQKFNSPVFQENKFSRLGESEVRIHVKNWGLNFRDVMIAMRFLEPEAIQGGFFAFNIGGEFAGIVHEVGKKVTKCKVGDRMIGCWPSTFPSFVDLPEENVVRIPARLSFGQATGLPIMLATAYQGLAEHAKLAKGERVLIHSAAGGVGLLAVQIAQAIGAEVFATAGSQEKWNYLENLGVKNIYNSRKLEFASQIRADTQGRGVDVVLNSLSGRAMHKSFECLAPFGRFIEIGKNDIFRNSSIGLRNLSKNISYFVLDLDGMLKHRFNVFVKSFQEAVQFFEENQLEPHPIKMYPITKVKDAIRFMSSGQHIGKVVIENSGNIDLLPPKKVSFHTNASYLITGGCSGLGLQIAQWMVKKGAGTLILVSRGGPKTPEDCAAIEAMNIDSTKVLVEQADVSNFKEIRRVIKKVRKNCPPLRGIHHAAMVINDGIIPEMTMEKYFSVFLPKAVGCWNLHQLTDTMDLDFFVNHSSISSIIGNPGQVNYNAANSFLDAFSRFLRSFCRYSITINWGVLGEYGYVSRNRDLKDRLATLGMSATTSKEALEILERVLVEKPEQSIVTKMDWQRISEFIPSFGKSSRFQKVIEVSSSTEKFHTRGSLSAQVFKLTESERLDFVLKEMIVVVAKIIGSESEKLDSNIPVLDLGLDSLMAAQIRNWVKDEFGINFPLLDLMKNPTIKELGIQLLELLSKFPRKDPNPERTNEKFLNKVDSRPSLNSQTQRLQSTNDARFLEKEFAEVSSNVEMY